MYATVDQARAAGATGTDAEVTAALDVARRLIDGYTGAWWEPTVADVVTTVGADGLALLPYRIISVTAVAPVSGVAAVYPTGAYRVLSSSVPGQIDAVVLAGGAWADPLVVGAEPWHGGYANLFGGVSQVTVSGTFGEAVTPPQITDAAATLAAWRIAGGALVAVVTGDGTGLDVDDEGNAVRISPAPQTVDATSSTPRSRTTGLLTVDDALAPLVRDALRIN